MSLFSPIPRPFTHHLHDKNSAESESLMVFLLLFLAGITKALPVPGAWILMCHSTIHKAHTVGVLSWKMQLKHWAKIAHVSLYTTGMLSHFQKIIGLCCAVSGIILIIILAAHILAPHRLGLGGAWNWGSKFPFPQVMRSGSDGVTQSYSVEIGSSTSSSWIWASWARG